MASLLGIGKTTANTIAELDYGGNNRTYLGMSQIGEECSAKLWLGFHWANFGKKHSAKMERTFEIGHEFEKIIIKQLKDAGMEVFRVLEDGTEVEHFGYKDEEQEEFIGGFGHAKGHNDGRIRGVIEAPKTDHLLEIKTMKEEYFKKLVKQGLKKYHPIYYAQTQRYMREMKLTRTLFIALNKNTSELHIERIEFDKGFAEDLVRKEQSIIMSDAMPERAYEEGFYKCGFCDQAGVCRGINNPSVTCRTCDFVDIEMDGVWSCQKQKGKNLTPEEQRKACDKYQLGWNIENVE